MFNDCRDTVCRQNFSRRGYLQVAPGKVGESLEFLRTVALDVPEGHVSPLRRGRGG